MDFARKQLEKYGWTEGKGLGKSETGISSAIKAKLKFDTAGLGHDLGEEFKDHWWEKMFDKTAKNIHVNNNERTTVQFDGESALSNRKQNVSFVKTSKIVPLEGEVRFDKLPECSKVAESFSSLSDEALLAACGGRTAHKGARHGLKQSAKLSRLEKQEKALLKRMRKVSLNDEEQKKMKKIKKQIDKSQKQEVPVKKRSNKKRKKVTFNETIQTKYFSHNTDTSFDSEISSNKDENSNEALNLNLSDEEEQSNTNISDLSKAERKRLKKKRKLKASSEYLTKTEQFLNDVFLEDDVVKDEFSEEVNTKKRKYFCEDGDVMECKKCGQEVKGKKCCKKCKQKKRKHRLESSQVNNIVKSMEGVCRISDDSFEQ